MKIDIVSIFPEYLEPLRLSLVGKAIETGIVELGVHDLRNWTHDRHRTVDDTPYGGGAGMVMKPEPWGAALDDLAAPGARLILLTPSGRSFNQAVAEELAAEPHLILACGRYEGIDARVAAYAATRLPVDELSIGDYVLNGGEAAALVVIEAVVRLLPGVIGNPDSLTAESHAAAAPGTARGAGLHQTAELAGPGCAGDPGQRSPRQDRSLAARAGAGPHPLRSARPAARRPDEPLNF